MHSLHRKTAVHKPSIFEPEDWLSKMIEWSLENESLHVALFRVVDVLPSFDSTEEVCCYFEKYRARVAHAVGRLVFLARVLPAGWLVAPVARQSVTRLARCFIVAVESKSKRSLLTGPRRRKEL